MSLSTSSPSDVNEKTELRGVDTYVTLTHDIGHVVCDVDIMPWISQNTRTTTALQNSFVRNIKNKNRKEHKWPEYKYPLVLGRLMKPSDSGVVNVGECADKQIMHNEIIEVDDLEEPERTFSRFDLTNRLSIWKLLSTQEKDKLKEAYEKEGGQVGFQTYYYRFAFVHEFSVQQMSCLIVRVQVWTGQNGSNSASFNDIRAIVKGLTLRGNVIDAYAEMLMYEQQIKAPASTDEKKSYIFSTSCLPMIRDMSEDVRDRYLAKGYFEDYIKRRLKVGIVETQDLVKELLVIDYCPQQKAGSVDCGIIVCFIMKQLVHHLDVDKSMGGESCKTMRAGMVKLFVNDRKRSFVATN
ncbi:hypothetical protein CsSME_00025553 [Camellia sinensis var. sinensis]